MHITMDFIKKLVSGALWGRRMLSDSPEPMDEDQFRQKTYENHREHFDHVYALHALAHESVSTYSGFNQDHLHGAMVLILPRAYKSFDAVRRLCEIASCEDAAVV